MGQSNIEFLTKKVFKGFSLLQPKSIRPLAVTGPIRYRAFWTQRNPNLQAACCGKGTYV